MRKKTKISIIVVYYHTKEVLFTCLTSIEKLKLNISYEIIVVDNDEIKTIDEELKQKFTKVTYIKSDKNVGYGAGVNLGAKYANGEYIIFVNPDCEILPGSIDTLYKHIKKEDNVGVVAAALAEDKHIINGRQGGGILTPLNAIFCYSFIHRFSPENPIAQKFFLKSYDYTGCTHASSVPFGLAMIKTSIFKQIQGFDPKLFLYFEDFDICKRVEELGYRNYLCFDAKVIHHGGKGGTEYVENVNSIYRKSRYYYFKKHYGTLAALLTIMLLNTGKTALGLTGILLVAIFLRTFDLQNIMPFIGDQGWYYLSARNMILTGNIPLVGIESSHPWLHQGAFWTYILGIIFLFSNFHPLVPGYFVAVLGTLTIFLVYVLGRRMFSETTGILAALFYATSPLIILHDRMPYHTSLISLFTLIFVYSLFQWVKGNNKFLPILLAVLAILYNFQISTLPLTVVFLLVVIYGFWKKKTYLLQSLTKKLIPVSFFAWLIPMMPMLIYDVSNGFPQTGKMIIWIGYKVARLLGYPNIHGEQVFAEHTPFLPFTFSELQKLIFLPDTIVSSALLFCIAIFLVYKNFITKNKDKIAYRILLLCLFVPVISYIALGTASSAYFPMFFVPLAFSFGLLFASIFSYKQLHLFGVLLLLIIIGMNCNALFATYFREDQSAQIAFKERISATKEIIREANNKKYIIIGEGEGSEFPSFTMNYTYLAWWLGQEPVKNGELKFTIQEENGQVLVKKKNI